MPRVCEGCEAQRAVMRRPKTGARLCRDCFFSVFEREVHETIRASAMFRRGDRVAVAASGGKDSTVLAHVLTLLNLRHDYGLDLFLLSVDEGITGYRDDSLEVRKAGQRRRRVLTRGVQTVKRNKDQYQVPLVVVSYRDLYGWTMDEIVGQVGLKNNCTFCGVFRRQALDRGAHLVGADRIATGHNADDMAETVLMNILRGDSPRLARCTASTTGEDGQLPRCKPFKYAYEKEIVMYAYFKKLDYFSTECVYAPNAYRGFAREFLKDLEAVRPRAILDILHAGETLRVSTAGTSAAVQGTCERCGYMSSRRLCKACVLLDGLARGAPKQGLRKSDLSSVGSAWPGAGEGTGDCACSSGSASCAAEGGKLGLDAAADSFVRAGREGASLDSALEALRREGDLAATRRAAAHRVRHATPGAQLDNGSGGDASGAADRDAGEEDGSGEDGQRVLQFLPHDASVPGIHATPPLGAARGMDW